MSLELDETMPRNAPSTARESVESIVSSAAFQSAAASYRAKFDAVYPQRYALLDYFGMSEEEIADASVNGHAKVMAILVDAVKRGRGIPGGTYTPSYIKTLQALREELGLINQAEQARGSGLAWNLQWDKDGREVW